MEKVDVVIQKGNPTFVVDERKRCEHSSLICWMMCCEERFKGKKDKRKDGSC